MNITEARAYLEAIGFSTDQLETDAEIFRVVETFQRLEKSGKFHIVRQKQTCIRCRSAVLKLDRGLCDNCVFDHRVADQERGVRA